jgi:hypothetical protein
MKIKITAMGKRLALVALCLSVFSCKDTFDYKPENVLMPAQTYQDVNDADNAILSLYGKLTGVMGQHIVLNELRADLMDVTQNADKYLREINEHHYVTGDNPWTDPRPYYDLILTANDVIKNFRTMLADKRMSQADFNIRYSEAVTVWVWAYLEVGIQYGSVPYTTEPLSSIEDIRDPAKYPVITFDQLLDNLIAVIKTVPILNPIQLLSTQKSTLVVAEGASLIRNIDGYNTQRIFLNRHYLFGDVFLWKGDYATASHYYRAALEYGRIVDLTNTDLSYSYMKVSPASENNQGNWNSLFTSSWEGDTKQNILTVLPFDRNFKPSNPFITLFSHGGKYQLKPSNRAIKNWDEQFRSATGKGSSGGMGMVLPTDPIDIYRGPNKSYSVGIEPEVKKLLGSYNPANPFVTTGKIIIYRSEGLHLRFAESANRDGRDRLAYAFVNTGIQDVFKGPPPFPANVTNISQSFDTNPDYYFDGREGSFPKFTSAWYRSGGIREHVLCADAKVDSAKYYDMSVPGQFYKPKKPGQEGALIVAMEDIIINENALELAFEGQRWADLVRIGLRREKEAPGSGLAFMKSKVEAKFIAAGLPVPPGVGKLGVSVKNWYLPFRF